MNTSDTPKRPVKSFGPYPTDRSTSIEVAIWENVVLVDSGKSVNAYNCSVKRSYRDDSGKWHTNLNFRPHDLPVLIHALNMAYAWMLESKVKGTSTE